MKILLTAINSKFIHSNLAVYCLKEYSSEYRENVSIREFTINNRTDYILSEIYKEKPDVIAISTYVWNIEVVLELIKELNKIMPEVDIWLGGPEVSFDSKEKITEYKEIKGIMCGEGEATFKEVVQYYVNGDIKLRNIRGITYRDCDEINVNPVRQLLSLDDVPFPYENLDDFNNKIIYYESSRGCPFSCSYCLSSIDRTVRFKNIEIVKKHLSIFIKHSVKQVKFVDRTFNCNKKHALAIWKFLCQNDNGITNFHFEISADLLDEETIEFLQTVRPNLFQFEIGVQSTNLRTIQEIRRTMDIDRLRVVVDKLNIYKNIHLHLDIIAGLPYEDYNSFRNTFNAVYAMRPEQLQLGFLKVLKGSYMYENKKEYGIEYRDKPPYEVLYTQYVSYEEMLKLKAVEEMVDTYYNSNQYIAIIKYMLTFFDTPFDFYYELANYYEKNGLNDINHSRLAKYDRLREFALKRNGTDVVIINNLVLFDLYCIEKLNKRPEWVKQKEDEKSIIKDLIKSQEDVNHKTVHVEKFDYDILRFIETEEVVCISNYILFDYDKKDLILWHAFTKKIELT
jgi:radical SAM superfamily enzyme YgiQ (UPF0313 family)